MFDTLLEEDLRPKKESETPPTSSETTPTSSDATTEADTKDTKTSADTDGKGCSIDEILAVLAHELGHWKFSHNLKNLFIGEVR